MLNLSQYFVPQENKVPIVEIREIEKEKNEIPSVEEFVKNYESDEEIVRSYEDEFADQLLQGPQYGPGNSSSKGNKSRNQPKNNQPKKPKKNKVKFKNGQHLIDTLNNYYDKSGDYKIQEIEFLNVDESLGKEEIKISEMGGDLCVGNFTVSCIQRSGWGGYIEDKEIGVSLLRVRNDNIGGDARLLSASAWVEGGMGRGGFTARLGAHADLVNVEAKGIQAYVGLNADSGMTIGLGGIEVEVAGVGFSIGKTTGISTTFAGISVDFEKLFS